MPSQFDAVARVSLDLSAFRAGQQQVTRAGGDMEKVFRNMHGAMQRVEVVNKSLAGDLQRTFSVYQKAGSAARSYATAIQTVNKNSAGISQGTSRMVSSFNQLYAAMSKITGLSEKEASRLQRTISLYERMANVVRTLAAAQLAMASVSQRTQQADAAAAREKTRAMEASRRLTLEEQKLALARSKAATAAVNADTANRRVAASAQQMASAYQNAARGMEQVSKGSLASRADMSEMESMFRRITDAVREFASVTVGAAISHEAAFAQVARVTGLEKGSADLAELKRGFEELAGVLPVSFEEFAKIGQLAAQTGVAHDALLSFSDTVARFSVTTGMSAEQTTLLFGRIQQMRQIPMNEMESFASTILALGTASASTEPEILKLEESIATVTKLFKLSDQATAALSSTFATLRVRPELARGALTRVFNQLAGAIGGGGQQLEIMAQKMGMTGKEVKKLYESDPDEFFIRFVKGMSTTTDTANGLQSTLRSLGVNAVRDIDTFSRLASNHEMLADHMRMANTEWRNSTELQHQSATILETAKQRIENLKDALGTLAANLGGPIAAGLGWVAEHLQNVVEMFNDMPNAVKKFGTVALAIGGVVAAIAAFRLMTAAAVRTQWALANSAQFLVGGWRAMTEVTRGASAALVGYSGASQTAAAATSANAAAQAASTRSLAGMAAGQSAVAASSASMAAAQTAAAASSTSMAAAQGMAAANSARAAAGLAGQSTVMSGLVARQREAAATAKKFGDSQANVAKSAAGQAAAMSNVNTAARNAGVSMTGLANVQKAYGATMVSATHAQGNFVKSAQAATVAVQGQTVAMSAGARAAMVFGTAGRFVMANWAPLLAVGLLLTPVIMAISASMKEATDNATEWSKASGEAVGGATELRKAVENDTKTYRETGEAVGTYRAKMSELTGAAKKTYETTKQTVSSLKNQARATYGSVKAMERIAAGQTEAAAGARALKNDLDSANKSLRDQQDLGAIAFGDDWAGKTQERLRKTLDNSGVTKSNAALKRYQATGVDLARTFALLETAGKGPKAAIESLEKPLARANKELEKQKKNLEAAQIQLTTHRDPNSGIFYPMAERNVKNAEKQVKAAEDTRDALKAQIKDIRENKSEFDKLARAQKIVAGTSKDAAEGMDALGVSAEEQQAHLEAYDKTVSSISDSMQSVGGPAAAWAAAMEKASASNSSLSQSQQEAAVTTKQLLEAMREGAEAQRNYASNLVQVMAKVPGEIATYLAQLGPEGASQVALLNKMTKKELDEYVSLWNTTSAESTALLAKGITDVIPALAAQGGAAGKAIADGITSKMKTGDIVGAVAEIEKSMNLLKLLKVNPKVDLDDAPAKLTMNQLIAWVKVRAFQLDVKGKADLDSKTYKARVQELLVDLVGKKNAKKFDINGLAKLNDTNFKTKMQSILTQLLSAKEQKKFDIDGLADLKNDKFLKKLAEIINKINGTKKNGELNVTGAANLQTDEFHRKLGGIVQAANSTGAQIQQALSRTATVDVVYRNNGSPPPKAVRAASGGWIRGPGGPTADKIPAMLSNREFVVNARSAARHRELLEAVNSPRGRRTSVVSAGNPKAFLPYAKAMERASRAPDRVGRNAVGLSAPRGSLKRVEGRGNVRSGPIINVSNHYPQAEPTSTTVNRSLAYAAALNGTI